MLQFLEHLKFINLARKRIENKSYYLMKEIRKYAKGIYYQEEPNNLFLKNATS